RLSLMTYPVLHFLSRGTSSSTTCTPSLHDALPFSRFALDQDRRRHERARGRRREALADLRDRLGLPAPPARIECYDISNLGETRSEEHTSELQSREKLVCRLLLEKKEEI